MKSPLLKIILSMLLFSFLYGCKKESCTLHKQDAIYPLSPDPASEGVVKVVYTTNVSDTSYYNYMKGSLYDTLHYLDMLYFYGTTGSIFYTATPTAADVDPLSDPLAIPYFLFRISNKDSLLYLSLFNEVRTDASGISLHGYNVFTNDYYDENGTMKVWSTLSQYGISINYRGKNIDIDVTKNDPNNYFDNIKYIGITFNSKD